MFRKCQIMIFVIFIHCFAHCSKLSIIKDYAKLDATGSATDYIMHARTTG